MKEVSGGNQNNKYSLKFKRLLVVLLLTIIVVLATAIYAVQNDDKDKEYDEFLSLYTQTALFNPFTLSTSTASTTMNLMEGDSDVIILNEPIRIATRPPARSPGKPWWIPGPPPWYINL
ncbi:MAG: hypothetical protein JSV32_05940 [Dehalococcoidia bacterium]|nr:MAG: hypothetical protein JSV32_05940 [Dehalococcoidia bacterium]